MPWTRLRYPRLCGGCVVPFQIPVGAVAYVTKTDTAYCQNCGVRVMREPPPSDLPDYTPAPEPVVETTVASEFSQFNRRRVEGGNCASWTCGSGRPETVNDAGDFVLPRLRAADGESPERPRRVDSADVFSKKRGRIVNVPQIADSRELAMAKRMLEQLLFPHRLAVPLTGPVTLTLEFVWPWRTNDIDPRWPADTYIDATGARLWASVGEIDWTVTNTPFSTAIEIIDHGLRHSRVGVAAYLRISIHEVLRGGLRRTWFAEHPPTSIHFLPRFAHQRSKKTGKWSTDSVTTCWTIWRHGVTSQRIVYAPTLVVDELERETPAYRARMDALMKERAA